MDFEMLLKLIKLFFTNLIILLFKLQIPILKNIQMKEVLLSQELFKSKKHPK